MKILEYKLIFTIILLCSILTNGCLASRIFPGGIEHSASELKDQPYEILGEAEGQASNFSLFWFVTVTPRADIDRAISNAISKKGGDDLIDIRWWIESKVYILGTVKIIYVKGKIIRYTNKTTIQPL